MNTYYLNDILIQVNKNIQIDNFINKYFFKNRLAPSNNEIQNYKIEDDKVILIYNDISFEFSTNQSSSLIEYYNARYTDLYSCCFNTLKLKVYLPNKLDFILPNGLIRSSDLADPTNFKYQAYNVANSNVNCTGITQNECLFFYRWYCKGLRDLIGYENMSKYDSNCNCYIFSPMNRVFIKMGQPVNCYDKNCSLDSHVFDPAIMSQNCQTFQCSLLVNLQNILGQSIDISKFDLNLSC